MPIIAEIERETAWLGDERAARALVLENDGLHNGHEITGRAIEAVEAAQGADAA
jgi:hypothetical protein